MLIHLRERRERERRTPAEGKRGTKEKHKINGAPINKRILFWYIPFSPKNDKIVEKGL